MGETEPAQRAGELEVCDEVRDLRCESSFGVMIFDDHQMRGLERSLRNRRGIERANAGDIEDTNRDFFIFEQCSHKISTVENGELD